MSHSINPESVAGEVPSPLDDSRSAPSISSPANRPKLNGRNKLGSHRGSTPEMPEHPELSPEEILEQMYADYWSL